MTSKLQKPSQSWNTGADHRRNVSHNPIVADSTSPPGPKIQSWYEECACFLRSNVRCTHPPSSSASTENFPRAQMSSPGMINHCVPLTNCIKAHRKRERSGVDTLRMERKK